MAQINLSHAAEAREKSRAPHAFDKTFFIILGLFGVVVLIWLGMEAYLKKIQSDITDLQQELDDNAPALQSEAVNRVADIDNRIRQIGKSQDIVAVPENILRMVESSLLPNIILGDVEFDHQKNQISVGGVTDSFKNFGEQYQGMKADSHFSDVKLSQIGINKEGKVAFIIQMTPSSGQ